MTPLKSAATAALSALCLTGPTSAWAADFSLSSSSAPDGVFKNAQLLSEPYGFGCDGENLSPQLTWSDVPEGTQSFVLRMHDPDAPTGIGGWTHWVVVNLPADVTGIPEGGPMPAGALETRTDFGMPGYGGACPPEGPAHRYVFTLDALSIPQLPADMITADSMPAFVGFLTGAYSLGQASLTVTYGQ
ncbi:YbhB/YbcL family Raf kinase inhibitor-like protein [Celeribacter litoreus]|uniref:YbhB/YbcL family Raf kinase inhibitor-like protein n=1 Tax=Celeribacter litoreus TaxID=2876714 RepID=UPI001CCA539B|nr:YbhB/YbcL family Raf kinase inhibitor-like protein [Celeribacter litoreus]MCA0042510.1 YbhB/YbcL family Raf kinase inhibitor-like protein [Celeribacter litoreus]